MLSNKVVVITGGAGLLGQEFSKTVMKNNGIAVIADFDEVRGLKTCYQLKELGFSGTVDFQLLNINDKLSILDLLSYLHKKYGKIDALVNNAYPRNKNYGRKFEEVTYEDFCENININLGGYFLTSQQFLDYFSRQGYGNIVNISSIYGVVAPRFEIYENTKMTMPIEYAAIKSALIHLTKYLAKYYKGKNIRINAISLGGLFDNQPEPFLEGYSSFCLNKGMLNKTDINGTLLYLLSDLSTFLNGQNIIVDDGFSL
jgi:NAD(P)-dependent dehydrogenase (short-subunit alcohol dehydrogenase family)